MQNLLHYRGSLPSLNDPIVGTAIPAASSSLVFFNIFQITHTKKGYLIPEESTSHSASHALFFFKTCYGMTKGENPLSIGGRWG